MSVLRQQDMSQVHMLEFSLVYSFILLIGHSMKMNIRLCMAGSIGKWTFGVTSEGFCLYVLYVY
jgi:hypothetical protein